MRVAVELLTSWHRRMGRRGQVPILALVVLAAGAALAARAAPVAADLHGSTRSGGHTLSNAVVWLDVPSAPPLDPTRRIVLDQRNLQFSPHVLAVRVGTSVEFPNNDRVFHNVFSFRDGKVFDLGMYPVGAVRRITFDRPGLSRIFCNIHPAMAAYIMAVDSPYFGVSNDSGMFTIAGVAPGSYKYHAWHAGASELTGTWFSGSAESSLTVDWP